MADPASAIQPLLAHALNTAADVPVPAWLFIWAAGLVLVVSFFVLALAWREPRFESERWRPMAVAPRPLSVGARRVTGGIGLALLSLVVVSAFWGEDAAGRNFSITFVFVTFWVGLVLASACVGDLFRALNPWATMSRMFRRKRSDPGHGLNYPAPLGIWPAVIGLLGFGWMELVFGPSSVGGVVSTHTLGVATIVYSAITVTAMIMFGTRTWLERGETFSVYFNMFSRISTFQVREGQIGRRGWLRGLAGWGAVPGLVPLALVAIGITTFDGAAEGVLSTPISNLIDRLIELGLTDRSADIIALSSYLLFSILFVSVLYWVGILGMRHALKSKSAIDLSRQFGHCLVPISLGYLVAHYFSYFVIQIQAQFTTLLIDPMGRGWNPFGLASSDISLPFSGEFVWGVQLAALLCGHVVALTLGHDRALTIGGDPTIAARSQRWMLLSMVGLTSLGLFLLSYSNQ